MRTLKAFGYNHIRTSHNPYSESFLRLADKYGILIVDELFDKWQQGGDNWVANKPFDQVWYKVETEWIRRDRNHPSIIMWSFGNELQVNESWAGLPTGDWGITTYRLMKVLAQRYDDTRPTMVAMFPARANAIRNDPEWEGNFTPPELSCVTDIAAYNYQYPAYKGYLEHNPDLIIYQSEATVNDLLGPWEGMDRKKMVGLAYWGAVEYWGESNGWPKKGWNYSFFSHNLDPYPQAWLIKSAMTDEPICCIGVQDGRGEEMMWNDNLVGTTFISSHWNRKAGSKQNVYVFTNAEEAELFVNGKSMGVKQNNGEGKGKNRMLWSDVEYGTGGKILAVARTGGKEVARHELQTTGKAVKLVITEEPSQSFKPDGMSLKYLHISAVDAKGQQVPTAADEVTIDVQGEATIQAVDNGDHYTDELMTVNPKRLYKGQLLLILRSTQKSGSFSVKVSSPNLKAATMKYKG
jgi:beta-galactosidase